MQNAKDSFYMVLRTRLAALNPDRTILLRGAERPGILVEEAESPFSQLPSDVYILRWLGFGTEFEHGSFLTAEECEIVYKTCGTQAYGGLDRGQALSAMDQELLTILSPNVARKMNYKESPAEEMLTNVFWDDAVFGPVSSQRDQLSRSAKVMVYSYQEQGD